MNAIGKHKRRARMIRAALVFASKKTRQTLKDILFIKFYGVRQNQLAPSQLRAWHKFLVLAQAQRLSR